MFKKFVIFIILFCYPNLILADCIYLKSDKIKQPLDKRQCFKVRKELPDRYAISVFNNRRNSYESKEILKENVLAIRHDEMIDGTYLEAVSLVTKEDSLDFAFLLEEEKRLERKYEIHKEISNAALLIAGSSFLLAIIIGFLTWDYREK